jgi:hypothetical protein
MRRANGALLKPIIGSGKPFVASAAGSASSDASARQTVGRGI